VNGSRCHLNLSSRYEMVDVYPCPGPAMWHAILQTEGCPTWLSYEASHYSWSEHGSASFAETAHKKGPSTVRGSKATVGRWLGAETGQLLTSVQHFLLLTSHTLCNFIYDLLVLYCITMFVISVKSD
jgi:hypothetical protein